LLLVDASDPAHPQVVLTMVAGQIVYARRSLVEQAGGAFAAAAE
jgi:alpha-D-ribose 1-methylphosphonate 5-triphosphate diphosphatase